MRILGGLVVILTGLSLGFWLGGWETFQRWIIPQYQKDHPLGLFHLPADDQRVVYLTIDDGPSSLTGALLDLMAQHDATSTLFVHTDHITDDRILHRAIELGHNLGHHMPADRDWSQDTEAGFREGFERSHCVLVGFEDGYTGHFRPPLGLFNRATMLPVIEAAGMGGERAYVMGSLAPWDAGGITEGHWGVANRFWARRYGGGLGKAVRAGDIVVFHDSAEARSLRTKNTLVSLRLFLETLEKRGLRARALPVRTYRGDVCDQGENTLASPIADR